MWIFGDFGVNYALLADFSKISNFCAEFFHGSDFDERVQRVRGDTPLQTCVAKFAHGLYSSKKWHPRNFGSGSIPGGLYRKFSLSGGIFQKCANSNRKTGITCRTDSSETLPRGRGGTPLKNWAGDFTPGLYILRKCHPRNFGKNVDFW